MYNGVGCGRPIKTIHFDCTFSLSLDRADPARGVAMGRRRRRVIQTFSMGCSLHVSDREPGGFMYTPHSGTSLYILVGIARRHRSPGPLSTIFRHLRGGICSMS